MKIVIDITEEMYKWIYDVNKFYDDYGRSDFVELIKNGTPLEQEHCEDAISRQAVLDIIIFEDEWLYDAKSHNADTKIAFSAIKSKITALPSVTPQPKIGHWIEKYAEDCCGERYSYWACSECGRSVGFNLANIEDVLSDYPYCHCGIKMVDPQESEAHNDI